MLIILFFERRFNSSVQGFSWAFYWQFEGGLNLWQARIFFMSYVVTSVTNLAKFRHFGKILIILGNFNWAYFEYFEIILNLLWVISYAIWHIFSVVHYYIIKSNLVIWSHLLSHSIWYCWVFAYICQMKGRGIIGRLNSTLEICLLVSVWPDIGVKM